MEQKASLTYVNTKIGNIGNTKTFKGSCLYSELPVSATVGDYWYVSDRTTNYCWNGSNWIDIGDNINIGNNTILLGNLSEEIINSISEYKKVMFDTEIGFYDEYNQTLNPIDQYISLKHSCTEGEKYKCSAMVGDSSTLALVILYKNDGSRIYLEKCGPKEYIDYEFTIPEGVTYFTITSVKSSGLLELEKFSVFNMSELNNELSELNSYIRESETKNYNLYARKKDNLIEIAFKYNEEENMIFTFDKVGLNSLMQISHFYKVIQSDLNMTTLDLERDLFKPTYSDWVGPYMVKANNNGNNGEMAFTGGWHGFNGDQTGNATAKTIDFKVYADNKPLGDNVIGCEKVIIKVRNNIQGYNTKLSDGEGRYVLEENIEYTITPNSIDVKNEIKALEDVTIMKYYGLQGECGGRWNSGLFFVGGKPYSEVKFKDNPTADNKADRCNMIYSYSDNDFLSMKLQNIGLGSLEYITEESKTAFAFDYNKVYFILVNNKELILNKGNKVFWQGEYNFYYNN